MMRLLVLFVVAVASIGCASTPRPVVAPTPSVLKVEVVEDPIAHQYDCPQQLSGVIRGRVVSAAAAAEVHVLFLMSGDATVDVLASADGSFEIPCVYPAPSYGLCVRLQGMRSCTTVVGPQATGLRLTVPGPAAN